MRRSQKGVWEPEEQDTLDHIKKHNIQASTLSRPEINRPFFFHTDVSSTGLGAVLIQSDVVGTGLST